VGSPKYLKVKDRKKSTVSNDENITQDKNIDILLGSGEIKNDITVYESPKKVV
jgi:hypothetical protein